MKKIILLFVLALGIASCSSDTPTPPEETPTYADTKPTQTKYKAYYGEKLTKSSGSAKSAETGSGTETVKPISVIVYPLTKTISFSNIFENTTFQYAILNTEYSGSAIIYTFKINETTYTCKITEKTLSAPASVVISSGSVSYSFTVTEIDKKKIKKLLIKEVATSPNVVSAYSREYFYSDTLVRSMVFRYKDPNTLAEVVRDIKYNYNGSKLESRETADKNGVLISKVTYQYTNNLIMKAVFTNADGKVTSITKYEYDGFGRITGIFAGNSTETNYDLIRYHSYEKNKLLTVYTNSKETFRDTEVSIYDETRKLFMVTQDKSLDPFISLPITATTYTNTEGQLTKYPDRSYEFSDDGYVLKTVSEADTTIYSYREE